MLRSVSFVPVLLITGGAAVAACSSPAPAPVLSSEATATTSQADTATSITFHIDDAMFQREILGRAHPEQTTVAFANGTLSVTPSQGLSILLFKDPQPGNHVITTKVDSMPSDAPGIMPQYIADLDSVTFDSASFQAHLSDALITVDFGMSAHFYLHNNYIFSPDVDLYVDHASVHVPFLLRDDKVTLYANDVHVDIRDHINGCIWGQACNKAFEGGVPPLEPKFEGMIRDTLTDALTKEASAISAGLPDLIRLVAATNAFPPAPPSGEISSPYELDPSSLRVFGGELQSTWTRTVAPACTTAETGIGFEIDCTPSGGVTLTRHHGLFWLPITTRTTSGAWIDTPPNGTVTYQACVNDFEGHPICSTFSGNALSMPNTNNVDAGASSPRGGNGEGSNTKCGAPGKPPCQSDDPGSGL